MGLLIRVFFKRPRCLKYAVLKNQVSPMTRSRKSSRRRDTPLPRVVPEVVPTVNSGDRSIEKISRYKPHCVFKKQSRKIVKAPIADRSILAGSLETVKPAARAVKTNEMEKIMDLIFEII